MLGESTCQHRDPPTPAPATHDTHKETDLLPKWIAQPKHRCQTPTAERPTPRFVGSPLTCAQGPGWERMRLGLESMWVRSETSLEPGAFGPWGPELRLDPDSQEGLHSGYSRL